MISNPGSIHTRNWSEGLQKSGIDVIVAYVKEWMRDAKHFQKELNAEIILFDSPSKSNLIKSAFGNFRINPLLRDLKNKTKIHQELEIIGKELGQVIKNREIDYVHAHGVATSALLAYSSGFEKYGVTAWGSDIYIAPEKYPYLKGLISNAVSHASIIHVESELSASRIKELAHIDEDKLFVSTWGVDVDAFTPDGQVMDNHYASQIQDKRVLLSFRALEPLYQIGSIIDAYKEISEEFHDIVLVIGSNGSEKDRLLKKVADMELEERVIFTGFVETDLKRSLLSNSYCYVQCPASDGVAITVMEAMASGLPIISSNVGENMILIEDGHNGILVNEPYQTTLANAMRKLLRNPELKDAMSNASRQLALAKHNRGFFFDNLMSRVKSVCNHMGN
ncbi:MAG: glycosyltransferase family 4 protein [Candidatus Thorarchaeota archaeon]|nr:glycosyltransferase family 4 protein [Candidatus Thorarchaeota archaeon]